MFAAARQARRFTLWILKHVQKYRLEFTENHSWHFEIPLQPTDAVAKILREIRHVGPFLHLAEELDQTKRKQIHIFTSDKKISYVAKYDFMPLQITCQHTYILLYGWKLQHKMMCASTILYLSFEERSILVRETQLPSITPRPTVGMELFLHAAYREQASQCTTSPWDNQRHNLNYIYWTTHSNMSPCLHPIWTFVSSDPLTRGQAAVYTFSEHVWWNLKGCAMITLTHYMSVSPEIKCKQII